jgi:CRP-like cAMP-binding protein
MPGESLYLIREGTIRISKMLAEGDEQTLVVLAAEDTFGEMAVLDSAPRSATARVIEDARLLSIGRASFERYCDGHPALGLKLLRNISRILARRVREEHEEFRALLNPILGRKES